MHVPERLLFVSILALSLSAYADEEPAIDFLSMNQQIASPCAQLESDSKDPRKTVTERAAASSSLITCLRTGTNRARMQMAGTDNFAAMAAFQSMEANALAEAQDQDDRNQADESFLGLKWGVGLGYSFGDEDFIEQAELVDGVIRVTDDQTDQARVLLEFHKYFWCNNQHKSAETGCGPFVAVAASSDDLLKGVGIGFMYGWRGHDEKASDGFSVGIGAILDNDVRSLADGFDANQPLPSGETEIRYETKSRWSAILFVTRTF